MHLNPIPFRHKTECLAILRVFVVLMILSVAPSETLSVPEKAEPFIVSGTVADPNGVPVERMQVRLFVKGKFGNADRPIGQLTALPGLHEQTPSHPGTDECGKEQRYERYELNWTIPTCRRNVLASQPTHRLIREDDLRVWPNIKLRQQGPAGFGRSEAGMSQSRIARFAAHKGRRYIRVWPVGLDGQAVRGWN